MTKLTKMTIRVPAELAERIKYLAHDTCESQSHVAAVMLAKALHKPEPKPGLTVRGTVLSASLLDTIQQCKRDQSPTYPGKIYALSAIREATNLDLYEAKMIADELWSRFDGERLQ